MTDQTRDFPLGDILSVTTGRLLSRDGMDGVYQILSYLTADDIYTHQIPAAIDATHLGVLSQHPQLVGVTPVTNADLENIYGWLAVQEQRFGASLPLSPVESWGVHDPIRELVDRFGPGSVIPVVLQSDSHAPEAQPGGAG